MKKEEDYMAPADVTHLSSGRGSQFPSLAILICKFIGSP